MEDHGNDSDPTYDSDAADDTDDAKFMLAALKRFQRKMKSEKRLLNSQRKRLNNILKENKEGGSPDPWSLLQKLADESSQHASSIDDRVTLLQVMVDRMGKMTKPSATSPSSPPPKDTVSEQCLLFINKALQNALQAVSSGAAEAVGQLEQRFATLWGSVLGNNLPADWVKVAVPEDASSLPHTTMTQVIAAQLLKCLDACAQQISALQRKVDQAPDPSILAKKDYQLAALVDGMRSLHQHQITLVKQHDELIRQMQQEAVEAAAKQAEAWASRLQESEQSWRDLHNNHHEMCEQHLKECQTKFMDWTREKLKVLQVKLDPSRASSNEPLDPEVRSQATSPLAAARENGFEGSLPAMKHTMSRRSIDTTLRKFDSNNGLTHSPRRTVSDLPVAPGLGPEELATVHPRLGKSSHSHSSRSKAKMNLPFPTPSEFGDAESTPILHEERVCNLSERRSLHLSVETDNRRLSRGSPNSTTSVTSANSGSGGSAKAS